jgi:hypothetical protein
MTLAKLLLLYAFQGGAMPLLMLGCAALALVLVLLKSLQLWLLLRPHEEQLETLEAISHVPSPTFRLQLLRQLRRRMSGLEGRLLDIVLATPIGGVRSERLAGELAYCRGRLAFWFALIARFALAAPAIGFVAMLYAISAGSTGVAADAAPVAIVLPVVFGTLVSLPALLLLFIADHYWLASLGQFNKHTAQLSQLPTGWQRGMV